MSRWGIFRRWQRWAVLEAVELYWDCRCAYHNAATFRCYFCGSRRPLNRYAPEPVSTTTTVTAGAPEETADAPEQMEPLATG